MARHGAARVIQKEKGVLALVSARFNIRNEHRAESFRAKSELGWGKRRREKISGILKRRARRETGAEDFFQHSRFQSELLCPVGSPDSGLRGDRGASKVSQQTGISLHADRFGDVLQESNN